MNYQRHLTFKMHSNRTILISLIFISFISIPVSSHPHMFINIAMKLMLSDTGLLCIHTYWEVDEMNSAIILDYYDNNNNGRFEKNELVQILKITLPSICDVINISYGLESIETEEIKKFNAVVKNKETVIYSFVIPCNIHIKELTDKEVIIMFQDPTMYIAFDLKKDLIQVSHNNNIECLFSFRTIDYTEAVVFRLIKKKE